MRDWLAMDFERIGSDEMKKRIPFLFSQMGTNWSEHFEVVQKTWDIEQYEVSTKWGEVTIKILTDAWVAWPYLIEMATRYLSKKLTLVYKDEIIRQYWRDFMKKWVSSERVYDISKGFLIVTQWNTQGEIKEDDSPSHNLATVYQHHPTEETAIKQLAEKGNVTFEYIHSSWVSDTVSLRLWEFIKQDWSSSRVIIVKKNNLWLGILRARNMDIMQGAFVAGMGVAYLIWGRQIVLFPKERDKNVEMSSNNPEVTAILRTYSIQFSNYIKFLRMSASAYDSTDTAKDLTQALTII